MMTEQFRMPDTAVEATPELMARIKKVNEDAFALHLGVLPALFLNAKVEKQGRTLFDKHYKANSYTRNYYNFIAYNLLGLTMDGTYGAGHVSTKLISGAVRSWPANGSSIASLLGTGTMGFGGASTNDTFGIVVGTGAAAESFEAYAMAGRIAHGNSAGQLFYNACTQGAGSYDSASKTFSNFLSRTFNNNSGGTIVVAETGLEDYSLWLTSGSVLDERTLLPSAITVPDASRLTITYTFTFAFPQ